MDIFTYIIAWLYAIGIIGAAIYVLIKEQPTQEYENDD